MHTRAGSHTQGGNVPVRSVLVLIAVASLSACAQPARVTGTSQGDASARQPFTTVLVVGVSPNVNQRCSFEFFMASQITSESTQGIASCRAVTQKDPLNLESIEQAVSSVQADAVLATSLISKEWSVEEGGSRDTRGGAYYKATDAGYATGYYGVYGVPVIYGDFQTAESITTAKGAAHVTSKLFETNGKTVVYTLDTKIKDTESRDAALHDVAAAIADRLRREGLIH